MVIQVRRGIKPEDALDILRMKVNNPQFGDFIINIKQNVKHRGDTKSSFQYGRAVLQMEEEYNRRKISTLSGQGYYLHTDVCGPLLFVMDSSGLIPMWKHFILRQ